MRHFKLNFLVVIALLAIGLTAATRPEINKKFAPKKTYSCTSSDFLAISVAAEGGTVSYPLTPNTCSQSNSYCYSSINSSTAALGTEVCNESNTQFCCAKIFANSDLCPESPSIYRNKLVIYCKN
jgi:hypothetical protein